MNAAVIGLGSMGRRRIRLLRKYRPDLKIIGIDLDGEKCAMVEKEFGVKTCQVMESLFDKCLPDCVFVCTAPLTHNEIIRKCLSEKIHVFTEINLTDEGYEENCALAKEKKVQLFLSSTFLYRDEITYIKKRIKQCKSPVNYNYHVGQYLPDWHPWESYHNFFVSEKKTNACREILAIELPWITDIFGGIQSIFVTKGNLSTLDIDYADNYQILLEHESGCRGALSIDVVSRLAVRNLEVFNEMLYLQWDGSPSGLSDYNTDTGKLDIIGLYDNVEQLPDYSSFVVENAYLNEILEFFEVIEGNCSPRYSFEKDKMILKLVDEIEGR